MFLTAFFLAAAAWAFGFFLASIVAICFWSIAMRLASCALTLA